VRYLRDIKIDKHRGQFCPRVWSSGNWWARGTGLREFGVVTVLGNG